MQGFAYIVKQRPERDFFFSHAQSPFIRRNLPEPELLFLPICTYSPARRRGSRTPVSA